MKLKLAIVRSEIMLNSIIIIQATQETILQDLEDIWGLSQLYLLSHSHPGLLKQLLYLLISHVLRWLLEHRPGEAPLEHTQPTMDQQWHSQTPSKAPFPGDQGGPAHSSQIPLAAPATRTAAAPTCTWPLLLPTQNSCGTGFPVTPSSVVMDWIVQGLVFSPAQPGIPSSCTGIYHLAAARSSAS